MRNRVLWVTSLVMFAGAGGAQVAYADIFTWVDASGRVNISNLDPPADASVTHVVRETAPKSPARDDAAQEALRQAEVRALAERVRQLQDEVAAARRDAARQVEYLPAPPPPAAQYGGNWLPPPVQYAEAAPPSYNTGCDPSWAGCGAGFWPGFYGPSVVYVRPPYFRHFHSGHGGRPPFPSHQPVRMAGGGRAR